MYCTNNEVKAYLGISGTTDDALIASLITAAQVQIDTFCHRTFEAASDSTRYFNAVSDRDGLVLWLDADLCSITTVTNGDGVAVTSSEYTTIPKNETPYNRLKLLVSAGKSWTFTTDPDDAIIIVGKWAYSVTAPADVGQACKRLAGFMYRQKDQQMFDVTVVEGGTRVTPLAIPNDVKEALEPYRKL